MENEDQAQNVESVEENTPAASPAEENQTSDVTETEGQQPEQSEEAADETQGASERQPRPAERRIQQLSKQNRELAERNQLLESQQRSPQFPQYQEGETITPERLQSDVVQTAQAIADLTVQNRLAQAQAQTNLDTDIKTLPQQYSELDDSNDATFLPELEKAITEEYQEKAFRVVGYNQQGQPIVALDPSVRLSDIAKRHVEVARAAATKSSANMKNAVAQTADEGAVKPQGDSKSEKPFAEKSIDEMEAELGFVRR